MQKVISLLAIVLFISSCATVRKDRSSRNDQRQHIDTSSQEHQYNRETITEEKVNVPVATDSDSIETSGTLSAEDTTVNEQRIETDDMSLTTTVKPKIKDGKVTGYEVNSKAVSKPKTVNIPTDKKTTTKETGTTKYQRGIIDTKTETINTNSKQTFRFNMAGAVSIVGIVLLILFFIYFKIRK